MSSKNLEFYIEKVKQFNIARGWLPVSQDIAKSIVIEAAELLELFQWDSSDQRLKTKTTPKDMAKIENELADILTYIIAFSYENKIDLATALKNKIKINQKKYPLKMFAKKPMSDFYYQQKQKYRQDKKK